MKSNSGYVELPKEAVKVQSFDCIIKGKRLFYHEVFRKTLTGKWIEIFDIKQFIKDEQYHQKNNIKKNCLDKSYIDHHNFHVTF